MKIEQDLFNENTDKIIECGSIYDNDEEWKID